MSAEPTTHSETAASWLVPHRAKEDLSVCEYLVRGIRHLLDTDKNALQQQRPSTFKVEEEDGRYHRVMLNHPDPFLSGKDLYFVGFFGLRSAKAPLMLEKMTETEDELFRLFPSNKGLLTYSSLEIDVGGESGNLVTFDGLEAIEQWRSGEFHNRSAVTQLSPDYYLAIRLHMGVLAKPLSPTPEFHLRNTKYIDYTFGGPR